MGCRIGVTVVLGKVDVSWLIPSQSNHGDLPVHLSVDSHPTGHGGHQFAGGGGGGGGLEVRLIPGGRRPPGPDNMGRVGVGDGSWC